MRKRKKKRKIREQNIAYQWFQFGFRYGYLEPKSYFPEQFSVNVNEIDKLCDETFKKHWSWFGKK